MTEERPFGWRPLTPEQREDLVADGWDEAGMEQFENRNIYAPNEDGLLALALSRATAKALVARLGPDFSDEVHRHFDAFVAKLDAEDTVESEVEVRILKRSFDDQMWRDLREGR